MHIDTFFSLPLSEIAYPHPHESDWLDIGEITVYSRRISIGDPILFPGDQAELEVANGIYKIQAKAINYGNDRRISRLRAIQTTDFVQTTHLTNISVDFARVGVCDPIVFLQA